MIINDKWNCVIVCRSIRGNADPDHPAAFLFEKHNIEMTNFTRFINSMLFKISTTL
jgi:hypothetical protein